ncbi:HD domain-containing protein [Sinomicrobium soli]|uniref:HD domain-containing protein n=1 Tax=Sinomicrobium sp. N-1-3-6 TaxID=2219864 RepID=UPI000DCD3572|nr:HD domain-containing protein [Sinomicrobium sp. N-1-3-6]RAV27591.1 phosphohydrolase [Sinomicrobium sp. N-1-3-6]
MTDSPLITATTAFVKEQLRNAEGGHDWFHIERVYHNAMRIASGEKADMTVVQLGALLHDIADSKFHGGDETIGPDIARQFLESRNVEKAVTNHVINIIRHISFKNSFGTQKFRSAELDIVQDADRLDAIGAIGIARAFNYGGFKNRELYNPEIPPVEHVSGKTYKNNTAPTINHFYEKLLRLKENMNTGTGRKMAEERHRFMEGFLRQFYAEWKGEC